MEILKKLFIDWELEAWANVLEVVGFMLATGSFIIGLFLKSEINKLKTNYIFNKRIKNHIDNLKQSAFEISRLLNDYDNNRQFIRTEFGKCNAELQDLVLKISYREGIKSRRLSSFLKSRQKRPFVKMQIQPSSLLYYISKYPKRIYQTNYDDVWIVYNRLIEIIRQMENISKNRAKSL